MEFSDYQSTGEYNSVIFSRDGYFVERKYQKSEFHKNLIWMIEYSLYTLKTVLIDSENEKGDNWKLV